MFSIFAEDFWRGLPSFRWSTSLRSWAYTLARNGAYRYTHAPHRRAERDLPLPPDGQFCQEARRLRSATRTYLRTETKSRIRELRQQLPEDDQVLLILRIDRNLSWKELAVIMSNQGDDMDEAEKKKWATRLRQRFQKAKKRLKDLARSEGLI